MVGGPRGAGRRGEQRWHLPGLALVPGGDQALGVLPDMRVSSATEGFLGASLGPAVGFDLTAVEAHAGRV